MIDVKCEQCGHVNKIKSPQHVAAGKRRVKLAFSTKTAKAKFMEKLWSGRSRQAKAAKKAGNRQ